MAGLVVSIGLVLLAVHVPVLNGEQMKKCSDLLMGQYYCENPLLNSVSSHFDYCLEDGSMLIRCFVANGVECSALENKNGTRTFFRRVWNACTTHKRATANWNVALFLSVFFGWLGLDRLYLGYYAIGIFKAFSLGFFFVFYIVDVVLIALQLLEPADGFGYTRYNGVEYYYHSVLNGTRLSHYNCIDCV